MKTTLVIGLRVLALGTLALGCGGKADDKTKAADASPCGQNINTAIDGMIAKKSQGSALAPDRLARMEKLRGVLTNRCTEDKWSPEMLACISKVSAQFELMKCQSALPPDQQQKLQGEIMGAMMGGGPGMKPGMPGMPGGHGGGAPNPEAVLEKKLVELNEQTDLLVRELSEVKSAAERDVVNTKIEKNRADKGALEVELRELRNAKAEGSAGSAH